MRCMHEAACHQANCFLTLTYDPAHLPARGQLVYDHFQRFMKRLRKFADAPGVRFYMCGEYGPENGRPHFHACIFGFDFPDKRLWKRTPSGKPLYTSNALSRLWTYGFTSIGSVDFESAAYVARYCVQKVTGKAAEVHYARRDDQGPFQLTPEFNQASRRPGIGAGWFKRFKSDVYPGDFVVVRGKEVRAPKFYDLMLKRDDPDMFEAIKEARSVEARANYSDNTDERLAVKEIVRQAQVSKLVRKEVE